GMDVIINRWVRRIDRAPGFPKPLHTAVESAAFGVRRRSHLEARVRGIVGQVKEKRLVRPRGCSLGNPSLGFGGKKIGRVTAGELAGDFRVAGIKFNRRTFARLMVRIVIVAISMPHVAEKVIETALRWISLPLRGRTALALETPFSDDGG